MFYFVCSLMFQHNFIFDRKVKHLLITFHTILIIRLTCACMIDTWAIPSKSTCPSKSIMVGHKWPVTQTRIKITTIINNCCNHRNIYIYTVLQNIHFTIITFHLLQPSILRILYTIPSFSMSYKGIKKNTFS